MDWVGIHYKQNHYKKQEKSAGASKYLLQTACCFSLFLKTIHTVLNGIKTNISEVKNHGAKEKVR